MAEQQEQQPLIPTPEFFQQNHGFPERAEKVLSDVSFVSHAHSSHQNAAQVVTQSLGQDVVHVTTSCVVDDIVWALGEDAAVENAEMLKCQHGTAAADGTTCVRSVLGSYNPEKLVLATVENAGLADEVKGLPVVVNANGGGVMYVNPSPSQVAYTRQYNQEQIRDHCDGEKRSLRRRRENLRQRGKDQGVR